MSACFSRHHQKSETSWLTIESFQVSSCLRRVFLPPPWNSVSLLSPLCVYSYTLAPNFFPSYFVFTFRLIRSFFQTVTGSRRRAYPADPFTIREHHNSSHDVPELRKIRPFPYLGGMKLWKSRSGTVELDCCLGCQLVSPRRRVACSKAPHGCCAQTDRLTGTRTRTYRQGHSYSCAQAWYSNENYWSYLCSFIHD